MDECWDQHFSRCSGAISTITVTLQAQFIAKEEVPNITHVLRRVFVSYHAPYYLE